MAGVRDTSKWDQADFMPRPDMPVNGVSGMLSCLASDVIGTGSDSAVQLWLHWFATSFGTTHGVVYASCKCMPLRHVNTAVFVSALRVLSALLRKHEW